MNENTSVTVSIAIVVIGIVCCALIGRGCYGKASDEDIQREAARQKTFQVCLQAGRSADECKRLW